MDFVSAPRLTRKNPVFRRRRGLVCRPSNATATSKTSAMNKSIIDTRISHSGKTRRARLLLAAAAGLSLAALTTARATVTIVHSFTGGVSNGAAPIASLTLSGSKLYGMTSQGGSATRA